LRLSSLVSYSSNFHRRIRMRPGCTSLRWLSRS